MEFRIFAYLRQDTLVERVAQLVNTFGIQPPWRGYKNFYKSPAQFLQILHIGILTDWQENTSGIPSPLATFLQIVDNEPNYCGYLRVELEIEPVFSQIVHPQSQEILAPAKLAALEKGYNQQIGHHGFMNAEASQGEIAKQGKYVIATLQSSILFNCDRDCTKPARSGARELQLSNSPRIRAKQLQTLVSILDILQPDYAFAANQADYELLHMGDIRIFPPLAPLRYLWSLMAYGTELITQIGQSTLRSTPAHRIVETAKGLLLIQPADFLFHPGETGQRDENREQRLLRHKKRQQQMMKVANHLKLKLPYETFI